LELEDEELLEDDEPLEELEDAGVGAWALLDCPEESCGVEAWGFAACTEESCASEDLESLSWANKTADKAIAAARSPMEHRVRKPVEIMPGPTLREDNTDDNSMLIGYK